MPTNEAANPTQWTILSGDLFDEISENLNFPSDQESSAWYINSSSSSCWSIISGNHKIITKGHAQNAGKAKARAAREACEACEAMKSQAAKEACAAKERGACVAKEQEVCAAEEREACAAEEQDASTADK
jgi:hypothetical protein